MNPPVAADRWTRRRLLATAAAASLGAALGRPAAADAGGSPGADGSAGGTRLRVLCYNIHHGEGVDGRIDLPRIAAVIRGAAPDLVALQEVDDRTMRTGGVDQTAELARLTGLHGRFGKQIDFEGGGYGQAILARFPLSELTIHRLPGTPDRERRMAVEARVTTGAGDLAFVSTHLHHANEAFRKEQAETLNALFDASARPVILAGDLNATPGSEPIEVLASRWGVAGGGEASPTYPSPEPAKRLDYVLFRPADAWRVVETTALDEPLASDHRPVLAVLERPAG